MGTCGDNLEFVYLWESRFETWAGRQVVMQDRFVLVGLLQISLGAPSFASSRGGHMGIVLNYCQYGVLYLGSYYNTGPYINFPHFGNSNLGKLPYVLHTACRTIPEPADREQEPQLLELFPDIVCMGKDCQYISL